MWKDPALNVTDATRLMLAILYLSAGWFTWWTSNRGTILKPVLRYGASIAFIWAFWYIFLVIFNPAPEPWAGHVNRFLHIGWISFLVAVTWATLIIRRVRSTGKPVSSRLLGT